MKKAVSKFIALILVVAFIIPLIPFSNGVKAEGLNTVKIYASKIKTENSAYYTFYPASKYYGDCLEIKNKNVNVEFIVDEDIQLYNINSHNNNNLTISGNKKLTVTFQFSHNGSYIQESTFENFIINFYDSANIKSGAKLPVDAGDYKSEYNDTVLIKKDLNVSGDVTVKSNYFAVVVDGDVNITGGEFHSTSVYAPIQSEENNVNISGGNVYLYSTKSSCIIAKKSINISGGYIETTLDNKVAGSENESYLMNFSAKEGLNISSPMYIKTPAECSVKQVENSYSYTIVNKDGKFPANIVIADKAAEEAAARKIAEEEAAKKAADEAAKKAAEDAAKKTADGSKDGIKYSNEWVNGKWYNADGSQTYAGILEWKCNSTGWWVEDSSGWYPVSQWQKIDGKWYYFLDSGYMDYSEYRDGYWLGADGSVVDGYQGEWKSDSKGWWFEDTSGWYPQSQWLWINGKCYYFESDGYLATSQYVDGYWVGADGASQ